MMKLGFVSAILHDSRLEEVVETASNLNYDCVELMCWPVGEADRRYAGVTHIDATNFDEQKANQVKQLMADKGVSISGLGYYPNPLSPNEEEAKVAVSHIRCVIETAATLGVQQVNTFLGRDWTLPIKDNWSRMLDIWNPIVEHAEQHQIKIGIENCPMLFSHDEWPGGKNMAINPNIWRRMFQDIPSKNFGLNYDPSHLVWQFIDYIAPIREFADRIFHVHAKDVRVNRHQLNEHGILALPLKFHQPKLPGLGEVDWGHFFSTLGDIGYKGPVCVEVEDRAYEESHEMRIAALIQSHGYLCNFMPPLIESEES